MKNWAISQIRFVNSFFSAFSKSMLSILRERHATVWADTELISKLTIWTILLLMLFKSSLLNSSWSFYGALYQETISLQWGYWTSLNFIITCRQLSKIYWQLLGARINVSSLSSSSFLYSTFPSWLSLLKSTNVTLSKRSTVFSKDDNVHFLMVTISVSHDIIFDLSKLCFFTFSKSIYF